MAPTDRPQAMSADPRRLRGSNQQALRAHNERAVLSLLRRAGPLAKAELARRIGLSPQTITVIIRALEEQQLLERGEPVRGRIGQPSVPISLRADGARFLGLKIGRRSAELVLIDFLGRITDRSHLVYRFPTPVGITAFVEQEVARMRMTLPADAWRRVAGLGVAMPYRIWEIIEFDWAPRSEMDAWRDRDLLAAFEHRLGLPVFFENDGSAACAAELVLNAGNTPSSFLYFYIGYFTGGGLVLNDRLFVGTYGNAAALGPILVPGGGGECGVIPLLRVASLASLEAIAQGRGEDTESLWCRPDHWRIGPESLALWLDEASRGLAYAILTANAVLDVDTVMIDGWMPAPVRAELVTATAGRLRVLDSRWLTVPTLREGTFGPDARPLGAASLPLSERYLVDPRAMLKQTG